MESKCPWHRMQYVGQVCKAFRLHRETCYLAFEYFDRLMHHSSNFHREHLQLAGLTVLFVAAKFEVGDYGSLQCDRRHVGGVT